MPMTIVVFQPRTIGASYGLRFSTLIDTTIEAAKKTGQMTVATNGLKACTHSMADLLLKSVGIIAFVLFAFGQASAATLTGKVVGVSDGDTITVLDAVHHPFKVRLSGIDAPEKKQPFGQRSKQHLSALVFGREVDVIWNKRDRYKRIVGRVMVTSPSCVRSRCPKAVDAGLRQVEAGMAWWYRKYAREQPVDAAATYERAEAQAQSRRIGLWSVQNPVPPWDWRKARRQPQ